jgi:CheY-like chemotaxis protein
MSGQPTVLIADDSPTLRRIVSTVLERAGFTVVVAEDGVEAVQGAFSSQPDAIILDVAMPVMTGLEALPLLRERSPRSLVVIYAGGSRAENEPVAMAAGAVSYFEKGVSAKAVVRGTVELLEAAAA